MTFLLQLNCPSLRIQCKIVFSMDFHVEWKMHGCTRKSMDIRIKVSVYTNVHGKAKHSTRKSMESLDLGKN